MEMDKDPRYLKAIELLREVINTDPDNRGFYFTSFQLRPQDVPGRIACEVVTSCRCTDLMVDAMVREVFSNPEFAAVRTQALQDEIESQRADSIFGGPPKGSA